MKESSELDNNCWSTCTVFKFW